jgi:heme/copper-type cytochrome/quinol oxidase subunit 2
LNFIAVPGLMQSGLLLGLLVANMYTLMSKRVWIFIWIWCMLAVSLPFQTEGDSQPTVLLDSQEILWKTVEIEVVAKKFEFIPNEIIVGEWDKVIIHIKSIDVTHGFSIPEFDVNVSLRKKKTKTIEFIATKSGEFPFSCTVVCWLWHWKMKGVLIVNPK